MKKHIELLSCLAAAVVVVGCGSEEPVVTLPANPAPAQTLSLDTNAQQDLPPAIAEAVGASDEAAVMAAPAVASDSVTPEVVDVNIGLIQEAVYNYQQSTKAAPSSVDQLVQGRFLARAPRAPQGRKYVIDQKTLQVTSITQ